MITKQTEAKLREAIHVWRYEMNQTLSKYNKGLISARDYCAILDASENRAAHAVLDLILQDVAADELGWKKLNEVFEAGSLVLGWKKLNEVFEAARNET